jgi:hypothetical protein
MRTDMVSVTGVARIDVAGGVSHIAPVPNVPAVALTVAEASHQGCHDEKE